MATTTSAFTASVGKTNNEDGSKPIDNVILVNGWLYGMTTEGGAHNLGTIFKVSPIPVEESNAGALGQRRRTGITARPFEIRSVTT